MKQFAKRYLLGLIVLLLAISGHTYGQNVALDTVDVVDYRLTLDIGHNISKKIDGRATLTIKLLQPITAITLNLIRATIDSVFVNHQYTSNYQYSTPKLTIETPDIAAGDTFTVTICYQSGGYVEGYQFGGFHFDNNIYYNLGVAFNDYPHVIGRAWYPCRDNFYDKATYHLCVTSKTGWTAQCGGTCDSVWYNEDGSQTTLWNIDQPVPTYLVSVAVAPFQVIHRDYPGLYGTYPATLGYLGHDSTHVQRAFDNMEKIIPMYEQCFGPYRWGRIGYISTPRGSMEHVNNIALASDAMASTEEMAQTTIAHEFSHSWFGNLITCATPEDMWFNEGGASFCEEVALQAIYSDSDTNYYKRYYETNLEQVLRTAHIDDAGYRAVSGVPHEYTYGSTVYKKGALVWHSLRGYMGDSIFYSSLKRLFDHNEYGSISSTQLRDSLSLYSGINLDDFFRFHVFSPGFVDYVIDSMNTYNGITNIHVRQKTVGTDSIVMHNKVDVTFFSDSLESYSHTLTFDGLQCDEQLMLPFEPKYAITNYDKALATASITEDIDIDGTGTFQSDNTHFATTVRTNHSETPIRLNVTHHWIQPDPSDDQGFVRMSKRYWSITSNITSGVSLNGSFYYSCTGAVNTSYPNLDHGFYASPTSFDSLRLVYREDADHPWRVVSNTREGNSREGYFKLFTLKMGDYAFAIIDTARLGVEKIVDKTRERSYYIYPNPSKGTIHIGSTADISETLFVDIIDYTGRHVAKGKKLKPHEAIRLDQGTYIISIRTSLEQEPTTQKVTIR